MHTVQVTPNADIAISAYQISEQLGLVGRHTEKRKVDLGRYHGLVGRHTEKRNAGKLPMQSESWRYLVDSGPSIDRG
jgi:hypothetical protein